MTENERQKQELAEFLAQDEEFQTEVAGKLNDRHRMRWRLLTLWICIFTLSSIGLYLANKHRTTENQKAVQALCAQRHTLDIKIGATQVILDKTKGDKVIFGIPRTLIQAGQDRDIQTRKNLEILDCTKFDRNGKVKKQ